MPDIQLSPFAGIDNVTTGTNDIKWSVDLANVTLNRTGEMSRRAGYTPAMSGVSSIFGSAVLGGLVGVRAGQLGTISADLQTFHDFGPVTDTELEYAELNGELIYAGLNTLGVVHNGQAIPLGVDTPAAPDVRCVGGAADDGRDDYHVATVHAVATYVSLTGEEGGASTVASARVRPGGSVVVTPVGTPAQAVSGHNVYVTRPDGTVFYHDTKGHPCTTLNLVRMPGGRYLRHWHGRIMVARGRVLYLSVPMNYGLNDPRTGFVQFAKAITFVQPVEGGIFVGQPEGVVFLDGSGPNEWKYVQTGAAKPVPGSSTSIDGGELTADWANSSQRYAVWLGERGYAFGQLNGQVVEPQSKRVHLSVGQRGATVAYERRLLSLVS